MSVTGNMMNDYEERIIKLKQENARLRKALEFCANEKHYYRVDEGDKIYITLEDRINTAVEALKA